MNGMNADNPKKRLGFGNLVLETAAGWPFTPGSASILFICG
jgi:hypothetical protein